MKTYFDKNTKMRANAVTEFEKHLPEKLNSNLFGKQKEGVKKKRLESEADCGKIEKEQPKLGFDGFKRDDTNTDVPFMYSTIKEGKNNRSTKKLRTFFSN